MGSAVQSCRIYHRYSRTSEAVGNFRIHIRGHLTLFSADLRISYRPAGRPLVHNPGDAELRRPVRADLGDIQVPLPVDVDAVRIAESLLGTPGTQELAREVQLEDLVVEAGADVQDAVAYADRIDRVKIGPDRQNPPLRSEHLDAVVLTIGDVDVPLRVQGDRVRRVELARRIPPATPALEHFPFARELDHAGVAVAVGDVKVPLGCDPDVGRLVEKAVALPRLVRGADRHQELPFRTEFQDDVAADVRDPDIVPRVDVDSVHPPAPFHRLGGRLAEIVVNRRT